MATFKKTMSGDDRYSITLSVSEVHDSVNITDNTSQITYTLTATKSSGSGYYTSNSNNPYKVTIDGVVVKDSTRAYDFTGSTPKTITLASGTRTIEHNTDGSKTISCSGYFKDANNSLGKATASGDLKLSDIPRASKISYSGTLILGTAKTIDFTRYDQSFKHTLSYKFESQSAYTTIATNLQTDTYSWAPPITLAQLIPASTSGRMDLKCDTYKSDGTTLVGTYLYSVMASIPSTLVPSASIGNPTIGGDAPSSWGLFVKGKSTATYTVTGTGNQGSTMVAYKSWVDGYTYDTASVTTNKLTTAGTNIITAYVIDSRAKQSTNVQKTFNVVDYTNPTISVAQVQRCDSNGNINNNGEYVYVSFNGSVTSLNNYNSNASTYSIKYKVSSASTYSNTIPVASATQSITKSGMLYTDGIYAANRGSGTKVQLSTTNTYNLQFVISDYFTTTTNVQTLDTGFDLLNFNASGKSMAIGKVSQATASQELLEVGLQSNFEENINASKDVTSSATITAKRFKTLYLTGGDGNTTGYRKIATFPLGIWTNRRVTFSVASRHSGCGILCVSCGNNTGTVSAANVYGRINYYGSDSVGGVISDTSYSLQRNSDGTEVYLYWKYSDNDIAMITVLGTTDCDKNHPGYYEINDGEWTTSIPASLTQVAGTRINFAGNAERDLSGNVITSTYQTKLSTSTGSLSITKTSGNSTCTGTYARYGNAVALSLAFTTTGTVNGGADVFVGKITSFTPKVPGELMGYYGNRPMIAGYGTDQVITLRNASDSSLSSGNTINIRGIIIV